MDLRKLKTLIELVESSGIGELEIQEGEERVRITRALPPAQTQLLTTAPAAAPPIAAVPVVAPPPVAPAAPEGHLVKSPMVGTFYRAASPGAKAFVEVGAVLLRQHVSKTIPRGIEVQGAKQLLRLRVQRPNVCVDVDREYRQAGAGEQPLEELRVDF